MHRCGTRTEHTGGLAWLTNDGVNAVTTATSALAGCWRGTGASRPPPLTLPVDSDVAADALVIGAGPAGSASAALLAEAGWRVVAIDRATFPREKPCSEYMNPEAVRMLDRLGVTADLCAGRRRGAQRFERHCRAGGRGW